MPEHGQEQPLDVLRDDVIAALHERPRTSGALEREAAAYRGAERDAVDLAGRPYQLHDPGQQQVVDIDLLDRAL